ncbi:FG-GAP repeat domain-containing protein, partial [Stagnihabitans tardus]
LSVTEFASDFVVNATDGSVTAGSAGALPATTFTYSDDVPNYNEQLSVSSPTENKPFGTQPMFVDLEPDGRQEVIFPMLEGTLLQATEHQYRFDPIAVQQDPDSLKRGTFVGLTNDGDALKYNIAVVPQERSSSGHLTTYWSDASTSDDTKVYASSNGQTWSFMELKEGIYFSISELDGDRGLEAFAIGKPYYLDFDGQGPVKTNLSDAFPSPGTAAYGDFDGNGITDYVYGGGSEMSRFWGPMSAFRMLRAATLPPGDVMSTLAVDGSEMRTVGDINGDGLDDLLRAKAYSVSSAKKLKVTVALSTGAGFKSPEIWYDGDFLDSFSTTSSERQKFSLTDMNSDGFPDLFVVTSSVGRAFLNTGSGFKPYSSLDVPAFVGAADVNGDALPDLLGGGGGNGTIRYSFGRPAN